LIAAEAADYKKRRDGKPARGPLGDSLDDMVTAT
jgi:hypothetical protein